MINHKKNNNVVDENNVFDKTYMINVTKKYVNIDDDSELITDPNTIISFTNKKSHNKHMTNESLNTQAIDNIYHMSTSDFIILSNLTLLSKIRPYQKLLIEPIYNNKNNEKTESYKINFEIKIDNSYVPRFTRWYYSQGRNETINAINSLIDISIEQFFIHKKLNCNIDVNKYYNLLNSSKSGLSNLKLTYNSDHNSISSIEKILEKINNFITDNTT